MAETIPDVSARHAHRAEGVTWSEEAHGRAKLVRRKFGSFGTKVLGLAGVSPDLTVNLDPLGCAVWQLCDGRTVAAIKQELALRFPGEADLASRLGKFLGAMVSKGLIVLD